MGDFFSAFSVAFAEVMDNTLMRFLLSFIFLTLSLSAFFRLFCTMIDYDFSDVFSAVFSAIGRWLKKIFLPLWARIVSHFTIQSSDDESGK